MMLMTYDELYVQFRPCARRPPCARPGVDGLHRGRRERRARRRGRHARAHLRDRARRQLRSRAAHGARGDHGGARADRARATASRHAASLRHVVARRNERDLQAHVVASAAPRTLLGDQQVIFLDVGSAQGVQVGNRSSSCARATPGARRSRLRALEPGRQRGAACSRPSIQRRSSRDSRRSRPSEHVYCARHGVTRELAIGDRAEMRRGY